MTEPIALKGAQVTLDPRLDAVKQFDERSRGFTVAASLSSLAAREQTPYLDSLWDIDVRLDQGREGACVGFGWSHALSAQPDPVPGLNSSSARMLYARAQEIDEWPGCEPTYSGTSVLAGAKAAVETGHVKAYRWAFTLEEALQALSLVGPVVTGFSWYEGMSEPGPDGVLTVTGAQTGRHCVVWNGLETGGASDLDGLMDLGWVLGVNSWGAAWGQGGAMRISVPDFDRLRREDGEVCLPEFTR